MDIKRYRPFHGVKEDIFLKNHLRRSYISNKALQATEVDIILPTYNRSELLGNAVTSVCSQLHKKWNLYICDDGSIDTTLDTIKIFSHDRRINYLKLPHKGVSHARNAGLKRVRGQYIAFLDSDNTWSPEYLSLMIAFMDEYSLDSSYCAAKLIGDSDKVWLGDIFDWKACVDLNYIDINCFITKSINKVYSFNVNLERFVDWDYILSVTRASRVSYMPLALVNYCNSKKSNRITTTVYQNGDHTTYIKEIQNKHLNNLSCTHNQDVRINDA